MGIEAEAQIEMSWPQSQAMLPGDHYKAFADGDGDNEINDLPIAAWPELEHKMGFGFGTFGGGLFGIGDGGFGFGQGRFGYGPFGHGGDALHFVTPELADGLHTLTIVPYDEAGNAQESGHAAATIVVAGDPAAPEDLAASTYAGGTLALTFTLSEDDDGA